MSGEKEKTITFTSARFGEFTVGVQSIIEFPSGIIGFPKEKKYVILEYKPPFSWLHSIENPDLAFVIIDGSEFGTEYQFDLPLGDPDIDLREDDEYAILIIVTVRSDPSQTTANLKAPLIVNLRNRKGVQLVLEEPAYSARTPLWVKKEDSEEGADKKDGGSTP